MYIWSVNCWLTNWWCYATNTSRAMDLQQRNLHIECAFHGFHEYTNNKEIWVTRLVKLPSFVWAIRKLCFILQPYWPLLEPMGSNGCQSLIYIYIYIYIGVRDLPLRDMISLGAWRMGLGCSGKILPSSPPPPSPPPPSPTRVWKNFSSFITESDLPECADRSV